MFFNACMIICSASIERKNRFKGWLASWYKFLALTFPRGKLTKSFLFFFLRNNSERERKIIRRFYLISDDQCVSVFPPKIFKNSKIHGTANLIFYSFPYICYCLERGGNRSSRENVRPCNEHEPHSPRGFNRQSAAYARSGGWTGSAFRKFRPGIQSRLMDISDIARLRACKY